jgi:hypothetical protein
MAPAASPQDKFDWAQGHFQRLRSEAEAFLHPESYRVRAEANADATEHRFYVEFDKPPPSVRWGLIFGDGVHCLRSALDHCVYTIGVKETGTNPPPDERSLAFPLTRNASKWESAKWRVESLSGPAQAAIESLQPHRYTEVFFLHPLGRLEEFDNADKHRTLNVVAVLPFLQEGLIEGLVPGTQYTLDHRIGPLKDDTPFLTLECGVPSPDVKVRHELAFEIGLPWVRGNGQETTLLVKTCVAEMSDAVSNVLTTLAPYY